MTPTLIFWSSLYLCLYSFLHNKQVTKLSPNLANITQTMITIPLTISPLCLLLLTSGRLHSEFVLLLFLQDYRETDRFFDLQGFIQHYSSLTHVHSADDHVPFPSPRSSLTNVHRGIGYHNPTYHIMDVSVKLMFLSVFDRRVPSTPSPLPPPLENFENFRVNFV